MSQVIVSTNPRLWDLQEFYEGSFEITTSSGMRLFFEDIDSSGHYRVRIYDWDFTIHFDESGCIFLYDNGVEFFSIFNLWNGNKMSKDLAEIFGEVIAHYVKIGGIELEKECESFLQDKDDTPYNEGSDDSWQ